MKSTILTICFLLSFTIFGAEAPADQLVRRLYLDLFSRIPDETEYTQAIRLLSENKYEVLVSQMMNDPEYLMTLAKKVVDHYAPPQSIRTHNFLSYKILEDYVKTKYLSQRKDFRELINDIIQARGIAAQNPMVLFYSLDETKEMMTGRFSAQVLGVPMKCAECHDHKIHPDITHEQFWSMTTFFMGMDKKVIGDVQELKKFEEVITTAADRTVKNKLDFEKEELKPINEWIALEKEDKSIYKTLSDKQTYGQEMGNGLSAHAQKTMMLNKELMLKAPQLFIGEYRKNLLTLKVDYELDGKKFTSSPSHFKRDRKLSDNDRPRDIFSYWMAWKEPVYISRAVANWTTNWLMGRGWIMPAYDTYKVDGPNAIQLENYAKIFRDSKYDIHTLIKSILMSPAYRMANSLKNDEEKFAFFKARRLRHLDGNQLVNSMNRSPKQILAEEPSDSNEGLKKLYRIAVYKNNLVEQIFPVSLDDTEASYRGTLNQSLKLSTDGEFLQYTEKLADIAYNKFSGEPVESFLDYVFIKLYTRKPTKPEIAFFKAKLNFSKSFKESGAFEAVWTLINSPEMRLY